MNNEDMVLCEKCGAEMHSICEGVTVGMKCPACGWGWVTTSPMISDGQLYRVILNTGESTIEHIKLISSIADCSYIAAKKLLVSAPVSVFSGSAVEVKTIIEKLDDAGVAYHIEPDFPY